MSNSSPPSFHRAAEDFARSLETQPAVRAVNYHSTPRTDGSKYRAELLHWRERFSPVTENDLDIYLASGRWTKPKPGLIIALYDATRNGYDVILPLIEEAGFVAWFFIVTGFVNAPPAEQGAYADAHDIGVHPAEYPDGRLALSWTELRDAERRGHVIASHARSHSLLRDLKDADRESEVLGSQEDMRQNLGHPVRTFVSFGGPAYGTHHPTDTLIVRAGYQFVFSNLKIQRLRDK